MKFEDIKFDRHKGDSNAIQGWVNFENGYEVSIIKGSFSHGGRQGLYEIGVFKNNRMCDPLGWGDEVKGWLTPERVEEELILIEKC